MALSAAEAATLYCMLGIPEDGTISIYAPLPQGFQTFVLTAVTGLDVSSIKSLVDTRAAALSSAMEDRLQSIIASFDTLGNGDQDFKLIDGSVGQITGIYTNEDTSGALIEEAEVILGLAGLRAFIDAMIKRGKGAGCGRAVRNCR